MSRRETPLHRPIPFLKNGSLILAFALFPVAVASQTSEIRFERIQLDRGVSDYRSFDVAQDGVGFLWFATANGLYRYDGRGYRIFQPRLNDTAGISSMTIWTLRADGTGRLWIGTFDGGLECYDPETESFVHYRHGKGDTAGIGAGPVTAIVQDRYGMLWVGMEKSGVYRLDPVKNRFDRFVHAAGDAWSIPGNRISALCQDSSGFLWIATDEGLAAMDTRTGVMAASPLPADDAGSVSKNAVSSLLCDRQGNLWAGTLTRGLNRLDRGSGRWVRYGARAPAPRRIPSDSITSIYQSAEGEFWIGTTRGIVTFDARTGASARYLHDPLDPNSLSSNYIRKVTGDRTGTIWIAADNDGTGPGMRALNKVVPKARRFIHFSVTSGSGMRSAVLSLLHDSSSDDVWIGSMWGLRRFNTVTGRVTAYAHRAGDIRSLSGDIVSALCVDRSGIMWVGTWGEGLDRFDRLTGRFESFDLNGGNPSGGNSVITISRDTGPSAALGAGRPALWVGVFADGLVHFSPGSGAMVHYRYDPSDPRSLSNDRVLAACVDKSGVYWVGTDGGGLNRFDPSSGGFVHYVHDDANPGSIRSNRIYALCEDPGPHPAGASILWIGTATGLDRFDEATGRAEHFTLLDSLSSIGVVGIRAVPGQLWVSTEKSGLFRFSASDRRWRNYTSEDGLHGDIWTRAGCEGPGGVLYLGAAEGFTSFHPDSIHDNLTPPPVVLASFNVFDRPLQTSRPLWTRPLIHLNYDQDFFSFQFFALDFTDPAKNRYAYRLEGFEDEWNLPGSRNFAGYTKVDPGRYVFTVKGANSDGVWNEAGTSIDLLIDPPYWRTWWFRVLMGAAAAAILIAAYNYRVSKLLEVERLRVRIASDLHDDIGSSLSGIALVTDSMSSRLPLQESDRRSLTDVTLAARQTADALRDIVWIVNPEHDTFDDIVLRMKDAAAAILVGVDFSVTSDDLPAALSLNMEVRRNVILVYKEILNNIARHARARNVSIVIAEERGFFVLRVADDGVGFDMTSAKRGNGLNNLERRARQVGGTVRVESSPGFGTTVEFTVRIAR